MTSPPPPTCSGGETKTPLNDDMCPLADMMEVHEFWQQPRIRADPICKLMTWLLVTIRECTWVINVMFLVGGLMI